MAALKILFIITSRPEKIGKNVTFEKTKQLTLPFATISPEEVFAPNSSQMSTCFLGQKPSKVDAIFLVVDPLTKNIKDNLKDWLNLLKKELVTKSDQELSQLPKIYFLVNGAKNANAAQTDIKKLCEEKKYSELNFANEVLVCPYTGTESLDARIVTELEEINRAISAKKIEKAQKEKVLAIKEHLPWDILEIGFVGLCLVIASSALVIFITALIGGATGQWTEIIPSDSRFPFDIALLLQALNHVFYGMGTSWGLGVIIAAFVITGIVAPSIVGYEFSRRLDSSVPVPLEDIENGTNLNVKAKDLAPEHSSLYGPRVLQLESKAESKSPEWFGYIQETIKNVLGSVDN